jgi:DNA-binding transcriptional MerR regulator
MLRAPYCSDVAVTAIVTLLPTTSRPRPAGERPQLRSCARALTIGDFSRITHLSVKMLRRYHEAGLLVPVDVDGQTGYRYYSTDQVPTAQVIRRFRDLGMPVREVREIVATADPDERSALISRHLERLERKSHSMRCSRGTRARQPNSTGW